MILNYNKLRWYQHFVTTVNTLQVFITNRCNLRCKGCFYSHRLDHTDMSLSDYKIILNKYLSSSELPLLKSRGFLSIQNLSDKDKYIPSIGKITLLGGEPLLHPRLGDIITENYNSHVSTTIYTNGRNLEVLKDLPNLPIDLRIGVYGNTLTEKPLSKVKSTDYPAKIVFMLRKDNINELDNVAAEAESRFNCQALYLSSIRDIAVTGDYWKDTQDTISNIDYANIIQDFVNRYNGNIPRLDISTRGVLETGSILEYNSHHCRFGNIFPNGEKVICPLDISKNITTPELIFNQRKCNKHTHCVLQKIVLKRR